MCLLVDVLVVRVLPPNCPDSIHDLSRLEMPIELHYFLKYLLVSAASSSEKWGCLSSVVSLTAWQGLT